MGGEQVLIFCHLADICCHLTLHIFFAVRASNGGKRPVIKRHQRQR
ncbi:Uncharacterised protein [Shigella sonnei]|nr:Uncharacterised protein [Shigella sonnei]